MAEIINHEEARQWAKYAEPNSNMARCYLDLVQQVTKLQTELTQQKECYRVVAKNLMGYSRITKEMRARIAELEENVATSHYQLSAEKEAVNWSARRIAELEEALRKLWADDETKIAELETELAAAKAEIATLAGLALDASNIFSYTEPLEAPQTATAQYETTASADGA